MFDVGFAELFLLALIGLLVLGPERLPKVAHTLGGLMRQARQSWMVMRRSIESELEAANLADPVKEVRQSIKSIGDDLARLPDEIVGKEPSDPSAEPHAAPEEATAEVKPETPEDGTAPK
jgi:sec-independent protein translocase protein TatB